MSSNKEYDQTIKTDDGKPRLSLVPPQILYDIAEVREYGCKKYSDPNNWKDVEIERYRNAAYRHFLEYIKDPNSIDGESGLSHLKHLACNVAFLCELEKKTCVSESSTCSCAKMKAAEEFEKSMEQIGITVSFETEEQKEHNDKVVAEYKKCLLNDLEATKRTKTYKEDFLEKFPNAINDKGCPELCIASAYGIVQYPDSCRHTSCNDCWNRPMESE